MDDVKSGIPSVPSDEVLQGIIDEVELHMYCDQWATCCVCDQRAPSVALPGEAHTHRFFSPEALPLAGVAFLTTGVVLVAVGCSIVVFLAILFIIKYNFLPLYRRDNPLSLILLDKFLRYR